MNMIGFKDTLLINLAVMWGVVLFVVILSVVLGINKDSKTGKIKIKLSGWFMLAICILALMAMHSTIPSMRDIKNESYVCVRGEYYNRRGVYKDHFALVGPFYREIDVTVDQNLLKLEIPYSIKLDIIPVYCDLDRFPPGKHTGTVWYSENSHYILEFIPDEPTDGN